MQCKRWVSKTQASSESVVIPPWIAFWKKPISSCVVDLECTYSKGNKTRINPWDHLSGWTWSIWLGLREKKAFWGLLTLPHLSVFSKSVLRWFPWHRKEAFLKSFLRSQVIHSFSHSWRLGSLCLLLNDVSYFLKYNHHHQRILTQIIGLDNFLFLLNLWVLNCKCK